MPTAPTTARWSCFRLSNGSLFDCQGSVEVLIVALFSIIKWPCFQLTSTVFFQGVNATAVMSKHNHTCAIDGHGGVKCWGDNVHGELGDGTTTQRSAPVEVFGLTGGVQAVATGFAHSCALTDAGGVKCWGGNWYGQLGIGTYANTYTPTDVPGLTSGVVAIATGSIHTCALMDNGSVKCWGYNGDGQLGNGMTTNSPTPTDVTGLTSVVVAIAAGGWHTCALTSGGAVKCWGYNLSGNLGDGTTEQRNEPVGVVGLSSDVTVVAAGWRHTCAALGSGEVKCWGDNYAGQLGDGTTTRQTTPVDVIGISSTGLTALVGGDRHSCALINSGIKCWGDNHYGQLGDGTFEQRSVPTDVSGATTGVSDVTAGYVHTCAVIGGGLRCWGWNGYGQLGDDTVVYRSTPVGVSGLSNNVDVLSAGGWHTCGLTDNGGVKCWGENYNGQLGIGAGVGRSVPVDVTGLTQGVAAISAGRWHTCVVTIQGGVKCWYSVPTDVAGLTAGVSAVATGESHSCALTNGGGVKCWGQNTYGQLGDGTTEYRATPVDVSGLTSGVVAITAGPNHTCALTTGGGVKCWGQNNTGQLGDGTTDQRTTPINISELTQDVVAITAGRYHTCALTGSSSVKCWGANWYGQLGNGTYDGSLTPIAVSGLSGTVTLIDAGENHTCALDGGGLECWGRNDQGQLGDGTFTNRLAPVSVSGLAGDITSITAGEAHTCAVINGGAKCWGWGGYGQLGDGVLVYREAPVDVVGHAPVAFLSSNYSSGSPGSYFTITGSNFSPNNTATITVNGHLLGAVPTDGSGGFVFILGTSQADAGYYFVTASVNPSATVNLVLDPDAPLRPYEGSGTALETLEVPGGIAFTETVYLPLVQR
jgi:alpha-tubulin suppressor-like RCC1 family protein